MKTSNPDVMQIVCLYHYYFLSILSVFTKIQDWNKSCVLPRLHRGHSEENQTFDTSKERWRVSSIFSHLNACQNIYYHRIGNETYQATMLQR